LGLLSASVLAGWLWQNLGAPATFWSGALLAALALFGFLSLPQNAHDQPLDSLTSRPE
jgi:predicted MFS family arabinose efflux permease